MAGTLGHDPYMRISLFGGHDSATVDEAVDRARTAADDGFDAIWLAQGFHLDALTALGVVANRVPDIDLGTAVVPIQGRHPLPLALQAVTVSSAAGPGRFSLGVGVTHQPVSEHTFGFPYSSAARLCSEELECLAGLLGPERSADHDGELLTVRATLMADAPAPGLLVAALGPKMLELAGRFTDGTVTWMTGVGTIARDVVPRLTEAARWAERPQPRVVVGLPVCVTDDVDDARDRIDDALAGPSQLASYRRMLEAEGVTRPVDIALVGDEDAVADLVAKLELAGATELLASVQGSPEEQARTRRFLGQLARSG
jgi:5,10-methylenetetrahydromethanopterin reductase